MDSARSRRGANRRARRCARRGGNGLQSSRGSGDRDIERQQPRRCEYPVCGADWPECPADNRIIAIDLRANGGSDAFVYDYVRIGLNAPADFEMPDNVALSKSGDLYIAEDPGGGSPSKKKGDDIWMASPGNGPHAPASSVVRFATLTDCDAEPTGLYFDIRGWGLFVNAQHRGGDHLDKAVLIGVRE